MFTHQNRRGLNRPILRPLWLITSAAADVISVPGVYTIMNERKVTMIEIFHLDWHGHYSPHSYIACL